jgi:predicted O-methyltransferase YrrM
MPSKTPARIQWISQDAVEVLKMVLKEADGPAVIAEVGVGQGASTKPFMRLLNGAGGGELHLFDREPVLDNLMPDLQEQQSFAGVTVVLHPNPAKTYASYAWELAKMARDLDREGRSVELFDFVYLDGAHAFHHDAAACAVLKRMLKPGGYLVLDDMRWTFNKSASANPTRRPEMADAYTEEQLDTPHVGLVADVLLRRDPEFEEIHLTDDEDPKRGVFRRVAHEAPRRSWRRRPR